jgi:Tetratrico peptide repeat
MRRTQRSLNDLTAQLAQARNRDQRAEAHLQLALFHDNNSREAAAVPHYGAAPGYGLRGETKAQALAWLASSLYKTGNSREAKLRLAQALRITSDDELRRFLEGLRKRIDHKQKAPAR